MEKPRTITEHHHDVANNAITITPDLPGPFGAPDYYELTFSDGKTPDHIATQGIKFQSGALADVGMTGITCEALVAVMLDRLRAFQDGPMRCAENDAVIHHFEQALVHCVRRSERRIAAGVKGTAQPLV